MLRLPGAEALALLAALIFLVGFVVAGEDALARFFY